MNIDQLNRRVEEAARSMAERIPNGDFLIVATIDNWGADEGLRFAFDIASAENLDVTDDEVAVAYELIEALDPEDRHDMAIAYSLKNSLKLLNLRRLVAA